MNTQPNNNVQPLNTKVNYNEYVKVDGHECFPEIFDPGKVQLEIRKHRHPECKKADANYVPDEKVLRKALAWWFAPAHPKPLGLVGETGTGKTEMLLYIADRVNEPVFIEKVTTGLTAEKFEGGFELSTDENGNVVTKKRLSKAAQAYKYGGLVILDEVDKANDDLSTALHLFLEGKPWTLSSFGETLSKHKQCRITSTANTTGGGGSDRYSTSQRLDQALRSRIGWLRTQFPERSVEVEIMKRNFPNLPTSVTCKMVDLGNAYRDAAMGPGRDGKIDDPLGCIFSTRTLVHWGFYMMRFGLNCPPIESLEFAFYGSVDEEELETVESISQRIWGDELTTDLGKLIKNPAKKS